MQVVFRTDASLLMGSGHVMRCLTLAEALKAQGVECHFISRTHTGNLLELIHQRGFAVTGLPVELPPRANTQVASEHSKKLVHTPWLGCDWQTDAERTRLILAKLQPDWLVVDHYALDQQWEAVLRPHYQKLMVIDDLADRLHQCDLLLDQNLGRQPKDYTNLVPAQCKKLLGPKYALLRPEFKEARSKLRVRNGSVKRIFVFFGGSDPTNETGKTLRAIQQLTRVDFAIDVVVGATNPHYGDIVSLCAVLPQARIYRQVSNMAEMMVNSDLAIGASGGTTWERCCIGLPSLVWCIAENQLAIAKFSDEAGVCINLGNAKEVSTQMVSNALRDLLNNKESQMQIKEKCLGIVDGKGVARVLTKIGIKLHS